VGTAAPSPAQCAGICAATHDSKRPAVAGSCKLLFEFRRITDCGGVAGDGGTLPEMSSSGHCSN
jgi:hypothetical protein